MFLFLYFKSVRFFDSFPLGQLRWDGCSAGIPQRVYQSCVSKCAPPPEERAVRHQSLYKEVWSKHWQALATNLWCRNRPESCVPAGFPNFKIFTLLQAAYHCREETWDSAPVRVQSPLVHPRIPDIQRLRSESTEKAQHVDDRALVCGSHHGLPGYAGLSGREKTCELSSISYILRWKMEEVIFNLRSWQGILNLSDFFNHFVVMSLIPWHVPPENT